MHSPGSKGTVPAVPPAVPLRDDHALPRSPVFSRNNASAGKYAVVLFVVEVSVVFILTELVESGACYKDPLRSRLLNSCVCYKGFINALVMQYLCRYWRFR